MNLIPALHRQRQMDFCGAEATLVYIVSSKLVRTHTNKKVLFLKIQSPQAPSAHCELYWQLAPDPPESLTLVYPKTHLWPTSPCPWTQRALSRSDTDLIGPAVKPGDLQGTLQITEARLAQVLDNPAAQGWHVGRQGTLRVFHGRCGHRAVELSHWSSLG